MSAPVLAAPGTVSIPLQVADPVVVEKPPPGLYTLVPFDSSRVFIEGDLGKDAPIHAAKLKQLGPTLKSGLEVELAKLGVNNASSMGEASGLVITGELVYVDAGNAWVSLAPGGAGKAYVIVVVRIVDASAPEKTLFEFLVEGEDRSPALMTDAIPPIISAGMGTIPWAIARRLEQPSDRRSEKAKETARARLAEARAQQVEAYGPAN